jgi:hypothetical protein
MLIPSRAALAHEHPGRLDHGDQDLPPAGLFVTVAAKLYARTGAWPRWFLDAVGEDVPHVYVVRALCHRLALERELGVELPVVRLTPPATRRRIRLGHADQVTPITASPVRGAA